MSVEIPNGLTPPDCVYFYDASWGLQYFHSNGIQPNLLDPSDVSRNILNSHWIFNRQAVALTFDAGFVDQYSSISSETWEWFKWRSLREDWRVPANARQTWSSNMTTFLTVRGSWSWRIDFFSTPSTTTSLPLTPTFVTCEITMCVNGDEENVQHMYPSWRLPKRILPVGHS